MWLPFCRFCRVDLEMLTLPVSHTGPKGLAIAAKMQSVEQAFAVSLQRLAHLRHIRN